MTRRSARVFLTSLLFTLVWSADARPQAPFEEDFASWLGLESGELLAYVSLAGDTLCAEVGAPREIGDTAYVPLRGLPWPGLTGDAQVLVPLDGSVALSIIRTPGPRSVAETLLPRSRAPIPFLPRSPPTLAERSLGDGWYAFGAADGEPETIAWIWCSACADAGTVVWFRKGLGITRIENVTIAGTERWIAAKDGCGPAVKRRCRHPHTP